MTEGLDKVYGVNHNQIDSIAHRTVRYLKVAAGGTMRAQPVMTGEVKTQEEANLIRRNVHNSENIYGLLVSLDDKAALIRANFIEGKLDYQRIFDEVNENVVNPFEDANTEIYVAGEPRLYGWVYHYAGDVFFILVVTYCIEWVLRWMYFHDWRGALRPTITGLIAAFWGLGFIHLIGLALDPLMLVMPFLITARAVSHAIQMHDRYYEEFEKSGWHKRRAIVASFGELFVPTLVGHHHRRLRRAGHPPRAGDHAAEARHHRVVVDPGDHHLRDAAQPDRLLLSEAARAGAGDAARARRLPQGCINRFVGALLTRTGMTVTVVAWLARDGRRALLRARPDHRRPDLGLAAAVPRLAVQRLAQAAFRTSSAASSRSSSSRRATTATR